MTLAEAWTFPLGAAVVAWIALLACSAQTLLRLWREPVFRFPVLVIESDDWGAGPLEQAEALNRLSSLLQQHRDSTGRVACLSLAVVLAVPDGPTMQRKAGYHRLLLDDARQQPILDALLRARSLGLCELQLHGLEHYWPETLMTYPDPAVVAWLHSAAPASTESLPPPLQSRWIDATTLPSRPHPVPAIREAVAEEVATYARILGASPAIVVPPTFVWTREVEDAWSACGIKVVVTPGLRYTALQSDGSVGGTEDRLWNGLRRAALTYLARTDYFEPRKGRGAEYALGALERDTLRGRPCILENHRNNFLSDSNAVSHAEHELDCLLQTARARFAQLRFASTHDIARAVIEADPGWIVSGWKERLPAFWERLRGAGRLWKLWRWAGLAALGALMVAWLGVSARARAEVGGPVA